MKNITYFFIITMFTTTTFYGQGPWNFNSSVHDWTANNYSSISSGSTYATYTLTDNDSNGNCDSNNPNFMITSGAGIDASNNYVAVTMKNNTLNTRLQIIVGSHTTNFDGLTTNDADFVTYYFDMSANGSWSGTVGDIKLRFKTANGDSTCKAGTVFFDNIEIASAIAANATNTFDFNGSLDNWDANTNASESAGPAYTTFTINAGGNNPNFENLTAGINTALGNHLAVTLFYAWYIPFYKFGIIHGDPHPGNYQVDNSNKNKPTINLLDFGCIRVFPAHFVKGVIDLYIAMRDDNYDLAIKAYKSWGFNDLSKDLIKVLNVWALYIYGPLLENKKRQIQDPNAKQNGKEVASNVYKELKKLGGVAPPKEFVLIDRAAVGLGSVFMHLNAELNWHKIIEKLIENFDEKELYKRQVNILKKFKIKET